MLNQTVRDYTIIEQIGAGGYGAVYRAHDASVDRDVAIKVILPEHAANADFKSRFEAEARLVAQLEHPHIVPLYSYWQDEQGAFLVMRFVRGGSMRRLLKTQGALSLPQVERWLSHLTGALAVAHAAGVIHRDLKPDNVLLDDLGNAYLTDFGIAKQLNNPTSATGTDHIMGTWHYLSPEQLQSQPVNPQSDIYALGFMLYEMLTGEHPFKEVNVAMMVTKHLNDPLPSLLDSRPNLPQQLDILIQKATAKDPSARYENVHDLLADFRAALRDDAPSRTNVTIAKAKVHARPDKMTPEDRNRYAMLDNVRTFWVEGVLEQSLYNAVWVELGMTERADAVDNPWQTVLKIPDAPDETLPSGTTISDVFDRLKGKLLILGEPGSGKTTTLLTLARDLLNRAEMDIMHPLPVVFNLSSWAENRKPLAKWMVDELNQKYQVPRKLGQTWIESEQILPLLDGLDEVALERRNACVDAINDYRTEHGFVDVVVCSRIGDYDALTSKLRLNGAIVLQPLQRHQVDSYLEQAGDGLSGVRQVLEDDEKLRRLTTSPLMLNILTLAYRDMEVDEIRQFDTLDGRRKHLFETYVNRTLERRGANQPYSAKTTHKHLTWLAKNMSKRALSVFYVDNLRFDWINTYLQRFMDILFLPLYALLPFLLAVVALKVPLSAVLLYLGLAYSGFAALAIFDVTQIADDHIRTVQLGNRLQFRLSLPPPVLKRLLAIVIGSTLLGAIITLISMSFIPSPINIIDVLIAIALFPIMTTLLGGVAIIRRSIQLHNLRIGSKADQGIWLSVRIATYGLILTVLSFLVAIQLAPGIGTIIAFLAIYAAFVTTWYYSVAVVKRLLLRLLLWVSGKTPFNISKFLDYAASRILLRKVGGGYVYLHRMLLDYFANLADDAPTTDDKAIRLSRLSDDDTEADDDEPEMDTIRQRANE